LKRIKERVAEHTAKKVAEHQAQAESTVVKGTDKATDSALTKSNHGLTGTMDRAGAALDTGLNRSERAISNMLAGKSASPDELLAQLSSGRAVLPDPMFARASADLVASSDQILNRLATALNATTGAYLIEDHVDASGDAGADQRLSEARASALKARLVSLGVPDSRLFAIGVGSARPVSAGATSNARVEVVRMR
jgi:outer membrane protein OmpA-like peptidoglycan-associated protein